MFSSRRDKRASRRDAKHPEESLKKPAQTWNKQGSLCCLWILQGINRKKTGLSLENGATEPDAAFINLIITIVANTDNKQMLSEHKC